MVCCEPLHWKSGIFIKDFDAPEPPGDFVARRVPTWVEGCWGRVSQDRAAPCNFEAAHCNLGVSLVCDLRPCHPPAQAMSTAQVAAQRTTDLLILELSHVQ